jgi:uncharacterized membrane protein
MALIGRLHPVLIHFPIALVLLAAAAETAFVVSGQERWRIAAIVNVQAAAVFAAVAVIAGWRLALVPGMEPGPLLEWHRWIGTAGAVLSAIAAAGSSRINSRGPRVLRLYRVTLLGAALLVGFAGHLGGLMVWGADFLRP